MAPESQTWPNRSILFWSPHKELLIMKAQEARDYRGGEGRTKMKPLIYQKRDRMAYGVMTTER